MTPALILADLARRGAEGITSEELSDLHGGVTAKWAGKLLSELRRAGKVEKTGACRNRFFVHVLPGMAEPARTAPAQPKSPVVRRGRWGRLPQAAFSGGADLPAEVARAIRVLRRDGFPVVPIRGGDRWSVGTVTVDTGELLARAERAERRRVAAWA